MVPVGAVGTAGIAVLIVTGKVLAALVPQELVAVTVIFPAVALGVAEILVVVELPVQPTGNVQV